MLLHVHTAVIREGYTLASQQIFHDVSTPEVPASRQCAEAIHYTVAWKTRFGRRVQCPSDRSSRTLQANMLGDMSVRRDFPVRNLSHYVPHAIEKI